MATDVSLASVVEVPQCHESRADVLWTSIPAIEIEPNMACRDVRRQMVLCREYVITRLRQNDGSTSAEDRAPSVHRWPKRSSLGSAIGAPCCGRPATPVTGSARLLRRDPTAHCELCALPGPAASAPHRGGAPRRRARTSRRPKHRGVALQATTPGDAARSSSSLLASARGDSTSGPPQRKSRAAMSP